MDKLHGNLNGLKPSERHLLSRISRRKIAASEVISDELAAFLCECSFEIKRQVGVLIDRTGDITHVIVGEPQRLVLPDLGRHRAGKGRLRGLRLVHTHLRGETLTRDDLIDLAKLRLDLIAAIAMNPGGQPGPLYMAHLLPPNPREELWRELPPEPIAKKSLRFDEFVRSLEDEYQKTAPLGTAVAGSDRALVVQVILPKRPGPGGMAQDASFSPEAEAAELRELCNTAGLNVIDVITQRRSELDPRFLIGKGKLDEVVLRALQHDATLLIFDTELSPAQARAISDATELKVIDRTMLILDIFAQHAHSRDGKLQVELAQLKYMLPRLVEKNTMMSRLTGGIGGRGPGETKLEINRRRVRERILQLSRAIDTLSSQRSERRKQRLRRSLPVVAIVGYTNAGKSTLLNTLSYSQVLVENKLFATLDPTSRRMRFPDERELILTDTVGFIRDLPKDLIAAFRATLEELFEADLLLHVVDASDPAMESHLVSVERILSELGLQNKPRLLLYNKIDRLSPQDWQALPMEREAIAISAMQPETVRPLLLAIDQALMSLPSHGPWTGWDQDAPSPVRSTES